MFDWHLIVKTGLGSMRSKVNPLLDGHLFYTRFHCHERFFSILFVALLPVRKHPYQLRRILGYKSSLLGRRTPCRHRELDARSIIAVDGYPYAWSRFDLSHDLLHDQPDVASADRLFSQRELA